MTDSPPVRLVEDPELSSAIREHLQAVLDEPAAPPGAFDRAGQDLAEAIAAEGAGTSGVVLKLVLVLGIAGGIGAAVVVGSSEAEAEAEAEAVAAAESESVDESQAEAVAESESVDESQAESVVEAEAEAESVPESVAESEPESVSKSAAVPVSESASESKPEPEPTSKPPPPSEITLVGRARSLLPRSPAKALASLRRCARLYPDGLLAMERDALTVEALFALGRTDAAVRKGTRFIQRYPDGTATRHIRELVDEASTSP